MKRIVLIFFPLISLGAFGAKAQVTVGDLVPPKPGTLLDLNATVKGGLLLANVYLTDLERIPSGPYIFPGIVAGVNDRANQALQGAVIYNTNEIFGKGLYVWNGTEWTKDGISRKP